MILRFAPWVVAAFSLLALWGMWQRGKNLAAERDAAVQNVAIYEQVIEAEKARQRELEAIRKEHEQKQRKLRAVPDDGCLDKRIPDDLRVLLPSRGQAGDPGAGAKGAAGNGR